MKQRVDLKARKARKQKIVIASGGVLLLVLLGLLGPGVVKNLRGPKTLAKSKVHYVHPEAAAPTLPISAEGGTVAALPDRDAQPSASEGQLVSFELFDSKDPFVQQIDPDAPLEGSVDGSGGEGGGERPAEGEPAAGEERAPSSAEISVNGVKETVEVGAEFPTDDPAFVLVSASARAVKIGIAGGSLATGDATVTLRLGKTLTLVNTADGTEYKLKLVSLG